MDPVQLTSCTLTLVQNVGSILGINVDTLTPHMGSCRILHDAHHPWPVGWEPVRIISKSHNFLFGTTTIQSFTFSNSHFFSGQSQHASSSSIMLYLWLGARRPTAETQRRKLWIFFDREQVTSHDYTCTLRDWVHPKPKDNTIPYLIFVPWMV